MEQFHQFAAKALLLLSFPYTGRASRRAELGNLTPTWNRLKAPSRNMTARFEPFSLTMNPVSTE